MAFAPTVVMEEKYETIEDTLVERADEVLVCLVCLLLVERRFVVLVLKRVTRLR